MWKGVVSGRIVFEAKTFKGGRLWGRLVIRTPHGIEYRDSVLAFLIRKAKGSDSGTAARRPQAAGVKYRRPRPG
jgi:hypothetical protein